MIKVLIRDRKLYLRVEKGELAFTGTINFCLTVCAWSDLINFLSKDIAHSEEGAEKRVIRGVICWCNVIERGCLLIDCTPKTANSFDNKQLSWSQDEHKEIRKVHWKTVGAHLGGSVLICANNEASNVRGTNALSWSGIMNARRHVCIKYFR